MIDPALLRPGRLDRCLLCPLPDTADRQQILAALTAGRASADQLAGLAARTSGLSGADLRALVCTAQSLGGPAWPAWLEEAASQTPASVTRAEAARYQAIYAGFQSGGAGGGPAGQKQQRVTLA